MKKGFMEDMLTLLADTEKSGMFNDRLSRVIGDTIKMAEEYKNIVDVDIDDTELGSIAAARKTEEMGKKDLFGEKKKK